jgi:Flp pilus assembly pilin Flp
MEYGYREHWPERQLSAMHTGKTAAVHLQRRRQMLSLINRFYHHERGATATEYAMLVVFVALAIAVGAQTLGNGITGIFTNMAATITNIPMPNP